jgi:hypothetical protein
MIDQRLHLRSQLHVMSREATRRPRVYPDEGFMSVGDISRVFKRAMMQGRDLLDVCSCLHIDPLHPQIAPMLAIMQASLSINPEDIIYQDECWKLVRSTDRKKWNLASELFYTGFSASWGWTMPPKKEELASTVEQARSYMERNSCGCRHMPGRCSRCAGPAHGPFEITLRGPFNAHLSPALFTVETGGSGELKLNLPINAGYAFFKDLVALYESL